MDSDIGYLIDQFIESHCVDESEFKSAVEEVVLKAVSRRLGKSNLEVEFVRETGRFEIYEVLPSLSDSVTNDSEEGSSGSEILKQRVPIDLHDAERMIAQPVRGLIYRYKKARDIELLAKKYRNRIGELVTLTVLTVGREHIFFELEDTTARLPKEFLLAKDKVVPGKSLKMVIKDVLLLKNSMDVVLSRIDNSLLERLMELEIPEIKSGQIRIVKLARDRSGISKVVVESKDPKIDPQGACIGPKGIRIQSISRELSGESIDIIGFSSIPEELIRKLLYPAKDFELVLDTSEQVCTVIVDDSQLSKAIGKSGVNVKLAAELSGWHLNLVRLSNAKKG